MLKKKEDDRTLTKTTLKLACFPFVKTIIAHLKIRRDKIQTVQGKTEAIMLMAATH